MPDLSSLLSESRKSPSMIHHVHFTSSKSRAYVIISGCVDHMSNAVLQICVTHFVHHIGPAGLASAQNPAQTCRYDKMSSPLSLVYGPRSPPLWNKTLADLIHEQELNALLAKALLGGGFKRGDCVGIMAGNCYQYIEVFLGAGRIGCPVAVFNNTFSPRELKAMIERTEVCIINNGRYLGLAMELTEEDVLCSPPPLFHAFGLVIGFLTSFCHGSKIVFPASTFDASAAVDAIVQEKTTALLGVPSMLLAILEELQKTPRRIETVRTGMCGGSAVSPALIRRLEQEMSLPHMLSAFGMTETGPVTFATSIEDTRNNILGTVGQVLPHFAAKVVDGEDNIVPRGTRGHICTSGYGLQQGYWRDEAQTAQAMKSDADGVRWMYTGDEGFLDQAGYMHITGRIKDIIIRGGENISPIEIEDRLLEHPGVNECCVVGLEDSLYGEVVSCFLGSSGGTRPDDQEIRSWVTAEMDHTKAPRYIFWLGESDVGEELPKTGSGKYQKHLIRAQGNALVVKRRNVRPKL
ncbi:hypothetical protein J7T55_005180 [Diaporthe amygdali]|uniref:uncharacterized protein n=1 Tax=Phomopsis amygdali TaxID=1214568 RepID=UPI0022FE6019|nr:uncharacterized protein J7T55_005180 [Diaporthe amygdali]KAJ0116234.1 hypothetical protein J7T55_005180 [Diaporthe amygdali]